MKKLNLRVKKNVVISVLVVVTLALGIGLISYISKENNAKDIQDLTKGMEVSNLKTDEGLVDNKEQVKVPEVSSDENKSQPVVEKNNEDISVSSNTETVSKKSIVSETKPEPPKEKPKTTEDITNKNKVPTYPEKEVKPQSQKQSAEDNTNKGQVNFPGFGKVEDSGENKAENVTSNGDINKQVGTMD